MDPLQRFAAYAVDFEKTFEDDDWTRLERYFAEDATYTVKGTPFDCEVRGRDAIFRAIKKSIDGFDRRFDKREIVPSGPPVVDGSRVTFSGSGHYEKEGVEPLTIQLSETAELDETGASRAWKMSTRRVRRRCSAGSNVTARSSTQPTSEGVPRCIGDSRTHAGSTDARTPSEPAAARCATIATIRQPGRSR